jgi:5'(3')-deoxyribonucleotidase
MGRTIYCDCDSTIINTVKAVCALYNRRYMFHPKFKPADWRNVRKWNFADQCPLLEPGEIVSLFEDPYMYEVLELMDTAKEVLYKLKENHPIKFCTIGTPLNLEIKKEWHKENLFWFPDEDYLGIVRDEFYTGKGSVDMSGGIFIDDHATNLKSSNADFKVCYGRILPWNMEWSGIWVFDWDEFYKYVEYIG